MKAIDIRNKFLEFFKERNHAIIPSASLIPENDPSVLFTTAGMHPLVPYLLGEKHPEGNRLADYQKCARTVDVDEVGDKTHLSFFEMLGNWSLGDYFKEESIKMSFEFLTKELKIPVEKLSVTCFAGNDDCKKDEESYRIWQECGIPKERIYFLEDNWWITGETGPCGSDTEIFYDTGKEKCSEGCNPDCSCGKYVEIWNNVFMEFYKHEDGSLTRLDQHNVDTGMGLERISYLLQGKESVYDTELFSTIISKIEELATNYNARSARIIADHLRTSIMMISDGAIPSNNDRGYVLRKLIRRLVRQMRKIGIDLVKLEELVRLKIKVLKDMYELNDDNNIVKTILAEKDKFEKTLEKGENEFYKLLKKLDNSDKKVITTEQVFKLYETYGFPPEVTKDLGLENNIEIDSDGFEELFKKHQERSKLGSEQKFKGGLAGNTEMEVKYHTATHLLNAALKKVLGNESCQMGSNITVDRLRFDFKCDHKLSVEEKEAVEKIVNDWINEDLEVNFEIMKKDDAIKSGAECMFIERYPEDVKVYSIGNVSKELCGGPHVERTGTLGKFKIKKEEASSSGVRRIKAILE